MVCGSDISPPQLPTTRQNHLFLFGFCQGSRQAGLADLSGQGSHTIWLPVEDRGSAVHEM